MRITERGKVCMVFYSLKQRTEKVFRESTAGDSSQFPNAKSVREEVLEEMKFWSDRIDTKSSPDIVDGKFRQKEVAI